MADKQQGDLISRSRLLRDIYFQEGRYPETHLLRMAIREQPAVDAAEVVHGRWIEILSRQNSSGYECSICKRIVSVVSDVDVREKVLAKKYPYCHCGAKMDGEVDDADRKQDL